MNKSYKNKHSNINTNKKVENKDGFSTENGWEWIIGLMLVHGLFSGDTSKKCDTEERLTKLETKMKLFEKILLG